MLPHVRRGSALGKRKTELSGMFGILQHVIRLSKVFFEEVASVAWTCGGIKKTNTNTEFIFLSCERDTLPHPPTPQQRNATYGESGGVVWSVNPSREGRRAHMALCCV